MKYCLPIALALLASPLHAETLKGYPVIVGSTLNATVGLRVSDTESHSLCANEAMESLKRIPSGSEVSLDGEWIHPLNKVKKKLPKCFQITQVTLNKMPSGREPMAGKVTQEKDGKAKLTLSNGTVLNLYKLPDGMITKLNQPLMVDTDPAYNAADADAKTKKYYVSVWIEESSLNKPASK